MARPPRRVTERPAARGRAARTRPRPTLLPSLRSARRSGGRPRASASSGPGPSTGQRIKEPRRIHDHPTDRLRADRQHGPPLYQLPDPSTYAHSTAAGTTSTTTASDKESTKGRCNLSPSDDPDYSSLPLGGAARSKRPRVWRRASNGPTGQPGRDHGRLFLPVGAEVGRPAPGQRARRRPGATTFPSHRESRACHARTSHQVRADRPDLRPARNRGSADMLVRRFLTTDQARLGHCARRPDGRRARPGQPLHPVEATNSSPDSMAEAMESRTVMG